MSSIIHPEAGIGQRRPLGVRLRFADVAAGFRLHREDSGPASSASTARSAFTLSSIAARRKNPASCSGSTVAAPVAASRSALPRPNRAATVAYLRAREQVTSVYREVIRSVWLENDARQRVGALAYVVDRGHVQYAGRLSLRRATPPRAAGPWPVRRQPRFVLATVKANRSRRFSRCAAAQLAMMLHDAHPHTVDAPPVS